jgi:hypothetical protein
VQAYVLIVSKKVLHVKRNESFILVPSEATFALGWLLISRREVAALAAVAAMLVPMLMLEGRVFSLPSLVEWGVESLIPGFADGNSRVQPSAATSRSDTRVGATRSADTVLAGTSDRSSRGGRSIPSDESRSVASSRGSRAATVRVAGVPRVRVPGVPGTSSSTGGPVPPTQGPTGGGEGSGSGNPGPGDAGTPAISVGVNGTTTTVSVEAGHSPTRATAVVSASTSGMSAAATVAGVSISAGATVPMDTGEASPPAVTMDASQVGVPAVTATVGSVAVSTPTGLTPS